MGWFAHVCSQKIMFTYIQNGFINKILLEKKADTKDLCGEPKATNLQNTQLSASLFCSKYKPCFLAEKLT